MAAQPLRLEDLLEKALAGRPARSLLTCLGARVSVASDLPPRAEPRGRLATGLQALDHLLPGGLPKGNLVELVGRRSSGRFSIALAALASVTSAGEAAALVDLEGHLDPQVAAAAGVDLELLLWVRPRRVKEALHCAELLLGAGFPLVAADLGLSPRGARYVPDAAWIRLARAAQAQDSSLLLLTPYRLSGIAADAVVTADAATPRWQGTGKTPRLLTSLDSRLTLQKLARTAPGTTAPLSLSLHPLPARGGTGGLPPLTSAPAATEGRVSRSERPAGRGEGRTEASASITRKARTEGGRGRTERRRPQERPRDATCGGSARRKPPPLWHEGHDRKDSEPRIHPAALEIRDPRPQSSIGNSSVVPSIINP